MINPKSFILSLVFVIGATFVPEVDAKTKKLTENQKMNILALCTVVIEEHLLDPRSFKRINSISDYLATGIVRYTATNAYGARIQQEDRCFNP